MRKLLSVFSICLLLSASTVVRGWGQEGDEEVGFGKEGQTPQPGVKKSRIFGIVGLTSTVGAVVSDALVEWNYDKYRTANESEECVKYRERTILMERMRDGFVYAALASFAAAIVFSRLEGKSVSANLHIRSDTFSGEGRLEVSLVKSF